MGILELVKKHKEEQIREDERKNVTEIIKLYQKGISVENISNRLDINQETVKEIIKQWDA